jgi:hypothetical protein
VKGRSFRGSSVPEEGIVLVAEDRDEVAAVGIDPLDGRQSPRGREVALTGDLFGKVDSQEAGNETLEEIQDVCDWWYVVAADGKGSRLRNKGLKAIRREE